MKISGLVSEALSFVETEDGVILFLAPTLSCENFSLTMKKYSSFETKKRLLKISKLILKKDSSMHIVFHGFEK